MDLAHNTATSGLPLESYVGQHESLLLGEPASSYLCPGHRLWRIPYVSQTKFYEVCRAGEAGVPHRYVYDAIKRQCIAFTDVDTISDENHNMRRSEKMKVNVRNCTVLLNPLV